MRKNGSHVAVGHSQVLPLMNDRVTDVVAVGALTSLWWLPDLATVSEYAALLSPIIGLVWLVFQIAGKVGEWHGKWLSWRIKRKQYKWTIHEMKRNNQYEEDIGDRTSVVGQGSGIPGDSGNTGAETQLASSELGRSGK